jgi:hypothetical protein
MLGLCLVLAGVGLMAQQTPSQAGIMPTCIPFCCNQDPANANRQCYYNGGYKTCSWFWVPGRSACL